MQQNELKVYNSLKGKKETFVPIQDGYIGMYVCGPTVYSDVHLGNVRTFTSFDVIYRYLVHLGYKVRYVRNITDVGHLLDDGEDRILKATRLEQIEPMEVVQKYTNGFQDMMRIFNNLKPSIEPRATGHIIEQIEMVSTLLKKGLAYEAQGSVYFDTTAFRDTYKGEGEEKYVYGNLSGRKVDDLLQETRDLKNQSDKKHPADFAIWMKASEEHIMRWPSPWSEGFPGWHLECSAMSTKYLGERFDIHGGGNDLKFPHHENEIAQNVGSCGCSPCNYWLHTNMLLMNGKKMSKSDGNTISPPELFSGESPHVTKGYSPMIVRFFMLQSHYRSTLDLSNDGLLAAEKGFNRLKEGLDTLTDLSATSEVNQEFGTSIEENINGLYEEMNNDFNTPKTLAHVFELVTKINALKDGHQNINDVSKATLERLQSVLPQMVNDVLGLDTNSQDEAGDVLDGVMQMVIEIRQQARENKDWTTSDTIRDGLAKYNIQIKDGKEGTSWSKS